MTELKITTNPEFETKLESYPDFVRDKMKNLRTLVIETAEEVPEITDLEETLKWGEPSFLTKTGSTLRMDWKEKTPNQYQMYFKCTSRLVETFKLVFGELFEYENNRAIIFQLDQEIPVVQLKKCIKATLMYHKVKDYLTLGI
ncbi:DUF1801 domain-containing protein [Pasteurella skyensis]|uniref:DUF1801 domain-containing protein n=1 Tax=Phocoenobacter skyensis TaxID=97481 RepID=A0AAJ6P0Q2_9PAST|nr:DUF1801 domain-containing protein [Pasteurella skyensis]MDP8162926.1 DUF1801 domain-containing protein [Pasteurella skyensis]MDP8172922.1 DUF1801 domain-containing protein [Pasteurella skyensis]MDP8176632.1 DUF1801 domain-containing protein [Pasteurella skyensis]MDP8179422.1 DUF1801 domain-containing protein [Pasteurella skyensis]MDP8183536.1 DUF1801 domain-containing protein [Pasteurella skyensis]